MSNSQALRYFMPKVRGKVRFEDMAPFVDPSILRRIEIFRPISEIMKRKLNGETVDSSDILRVDRKLRSDLVNDPELVYRLEARSDSIGKLRIWVDYGIVLPISTLVSNLGLVLRSNRFSYMGSKFSLIATEDTSAFQGLTLRDKEGAIFVLLDLPSIVEFSCKVLCALDHSEARVKSYTEDPSDQNLIKAIAHVTIISIRDDIYSNYSLEQALLALVNAFLASAATHECAHVSLSRQKLNIGSGKITLFNQELIAHLFQLAYSDPVIPISGLHSIQDSTPEYEVSSTLSKLLFPRLGLLTPESIMKFNPAEDRKRVSEIARKLLDETCIRLFGKHEDEILNGKEISEVFERGFRFLGEKRIPMIEAFINL